MKGLPFSLVQEWAKYSVYANLNRDKVVQSNKAILNPSSAIVSNLKQAIVHQKLTKTKKTKAGYGFGAFNLLEPINQAVLGMYKKPTPIQQKTIPILMDGRNVVAMARTGSGKTAAFLLPILQFLESHSNIYGPRALILAPSHELVIQIHSFAKKFGKNTDLRAVAIVGGDSMEKQFDLLSQNPDLIIATPGRLLHLMVQIPNYSLQTVKMVILDEADRIVEEQSLYDQLKAILSKTPKQRQTCLFSATLPNSLVDFVRLGLSNPYFIRLDSELRISPTLTINSFYLRNLEEKDALLLVLVEKICSKSTICFIGVHQQALYLSSLLNCFGKQDSFTIIHGQMDSNSRKIEMSRFREGSVTLLIVTDVAARGLDVPEIDNVINFDFPSDPRVFVHRVGRAGRAGRVGSVYNFITPREMGYLFTCYEFLGRKMSEHVDNSNLQQLQPMFQDIESDNEDDDSLEGINDDKSEKINCNNPLSFGILPKGYLSLPMDAISKSSNALDFKILRRNRTNAYHKLQQFQKKPSDSAARRTARFIQRLNSTSIIYAMPVHPLFASNQENTQLLFAKQMDSWRPENTNKPAIDDLALSYHNHNIRNEFRTAGSLKSTTLSPFLSSSSSIKSQEFDVFPSQKSASEQMYSLRQRSDSSNQMALDLIGDDVEGLKKHNHRKVWDSRKRRWVNDQSTDIWKEYSASTGRTQVDTVNEAGVRIAAGSKSKTSQYENWMKATKQRIPNIGTFVGGDSASSFTFSQPTSSSSSSAPSKVSITQLSDRSRHYIHSGTKVKQSQKVAGGTQSVLESDRIANKIRLLQQQKSQYQSSNSNARSRQLKSKTQIISARKKRARKQMYNKKKH